ncbi:hypothetical protein BD414DRAFT_158740 [Trametes punicea]|nr:hypothetical protein BD414DRAFT_158740 [Trametes punicea]
MPRARIAKGANTSSTLASDTHELSPKQGHDAPVTSSYPRTRSQTKASPPLKRRASDKATLKTARPAKMARKHSSDSSAPSDPSPEAVAIGVSSTDGTKVPSPIGRTMWPPDVPRSMLFNFTVGAPSFKAYDDTKEVVAHRKHSCKDRPVFLATGPETMFDHSWRLTFVEPSNSANKPACAPLATVGTPATIDTHNAAATVPHSSPAPSTVTKSLLPVEHVPPSGMHGHETGIENVVVLNATPALSQDASEIRKGHSIRRDGPPTPLFQSTNLGPARQHDRVSLAQPSVQPPHSFAANGVLSDGFRLETQESSFQASQIPIYAPIPTAIASLSLSSHLCVASPHARSVSPGTVPPDPLFVHSFQDIQQHSTLEFAPPISTSHSQMSGIPRSVGEEPHHARRKSALSGPCQFGASPSQSPLAHPHCHFRHLNPISIPPSLPGHPTSLGLGGGMSQPFSIFGHVTELINLPRPQGVARGPPPCIHPLPVPLPSPFFPPAPHQSYLSRSGAPWSALYDSIKRSRDLLREKGKNQLASGSAPGHIASTGSDDSEDKFPRPGAWQPHRCPFCPRTFSLPNGLAIHLKWHWGATGLAWKKGISRRSKTIERALQDAERRREEAARQQQDRDFPGLPAPLNGMVGHAPGESLMPTTSLAQVDGAPPFSMPIMAQQSFSSFDLSLCPSQPSSLSESPYSSPIEVHNPHTFPPPVIAAASSSSPIYGGILPHTPELLPDTSSANSTKTGHESPGWSEDSLFGRDEATNADAEGDYVNEDLFGDCSGGRARDTGSADVRSDRRISLTDSFVSAGGYHEYVASTHSCRVRPPIPRAPRLVPLRLPPMFFDDEDEEFGDVDDECGRAISGEDGGDLFFGVSRMEPRAMDGLGPLPELVSLSSLPELDDAFENLSLF